MIPLSRVSTDPNATPATAINTITGWLDASMVYGSDSATAASLRNANGTMKTSAGDNLPIVNGQFAAGDVRAQENPDLTALQTLFVREHNFQVHQLAQAHKDWTGDQLYAQARAIVGAEIANITYSEFLPHLLGSAAPGAYQGFNPNVDPRISEEFEGAAYRFGHSLVSGDIEAIDNNGNVTSSQALKDVFFEPPAAFAATGADGLLRHLASDTSNAMDARLIADLRNFLNDPPAVTDLASINIQRGRDLGFGTLNQTRVALGLPAYTDFAQITDDQGTVDALRQAYGDVNAIDLWTGGLAEKRVDGGMLGQTFTDIVADQFERLRDGDRFYFENQGFDPQTLADIKSTTLSSVIVNNTDTNFMQPDAFVSTIRHTGELGGVNSEEPDAPQLVIGSKGNDTLVGGPQADTLVVEQGHPTLTGGGGADRFVFDAPGIQATITDFNPKEDVLVFDPMVANLNKINVQFVQGSAVVQAAGDTITLNHVTPDALTAANFFPATDFKVT